MSENMLGHVVEESGMGCDSIPEVEIIDLLRTCRQIMLSQMQYLADLEPSDPVANLVLEQAQRTANFYTELHGTTLLQK